VSNCIQTDLWQIKSHSPFVSVASNVIVIFSFGNFFFLLRPFVSIPGK
jgi:hypothetical protein